MGSSRSSSHPEDELRVVITSSVNTESDVDSAFHSHAAHLLFSVCASSINPRTTRVAAFQKIHRFIFPVSKNEKNKCVVRRFPVGLSVGRSVRHTRAEFPRNGPNSDKITSGIRKYAIWKTIKRQVRGQLARTHLLSELCSTC